MILQKLTQPILYIGAAFFGSLMYGSYYFGRNIMWKDDVNQSEQKIMDHQTKHFDLLAGKIDLVDRKMKVEIKGTTVNLEAQIKGTKDEIEAQIKGTKDEIIKEMKSLMSEK